MKPIPTQGTHIVNSELHPRTSVIVASFGDTGAIHLIACEGAEPNGRPFILDAAAARELASYITELQS